LLFFLQLTIFVKPNPKTPPNVTTEPYFRAMTMIAPALCSLVCALFMAMLLRDYRGSGKRRTRLGAMVAFLTISALWFVAAALTIPVGGIDPPAPAPILLVAAAVAIPSGQVWLTWRIIKRGGLDHEATAEMIHQPRSTRPAIIGDQTAMSLHKELTEQKLEEYFKAKRPYLDPDFKLMDLADAMDVNRSEMSAFINRTYGMGFKRYVNRWRLAEFQRLMALPSNELKNPYRVVKMAGFTDPRHYHRVAEQENAEEPAPQSVTA
jgi:AraC-like DNA-binding protein